MIIVGLELRRAGIRFIEVESTTGNDGKGTTVEKFRCEAHVDLEKFLWWAARRQIKVLDAAIELVAEPPEDEHTLLGMGEGAPW